MLNVGIVGAGIAGLHLGLQLLRSGKNVTIYSDLSPEQQRAAPLMSTVALSAHTLARDRALDGTSWNAPLLAGMRIAVGPMRITGHGQRPWAAVDMRLFLAKRMEDFVQQGGRFELGAVSTADVAGLTEKHDLVVISTGRRGLSELFEKDPSLSAPAPLRQLVGGQFLGFREYRPAYVSLAVCPGHGEVVTIPGLAVEGRRTNMLFEIIPGGAFDPLLRQRYEDDPQGYEQLILQLLQRHCPSLYSQIEPEKFRLSRPLDLLRGSVTPTVRRGYRVLVNGKPVLALGDTFASVDPLVGQGANLASRCAAAMGKQILEATELDEGFCQRVEAELRELAEPVVRWSTSMLLPPLPHVLDLFRAASENPGLANTFVNNFEYPARQWRLLSSPERTRQLIFSQAA